MRKAIAFSKPTCCFERSERLPSQAIFPGRSARVQWAEWVAGGGVEGWVGTEHDRSSMVGGIAGHEDDLRASFRGRRSYRRHPRSVVRRIMPLRPRNIAPFADRCQGPLRVETFRREASPSD
jgi:hypothetical protein